MNNARSLALRVTLLILGLYTSQELLARVALDARNHHIPLKSSQHNVEIALL